MIDSFDMGIHSKIPLCCVEAFCKDEAAGIRHIAKARYEQYGKEFDSDFSFSYVPCPKCFEQFLMGALVPKKIHKCTPKCGDFYQKGEKNDKN